MTYPECHRRLVDVAITVLVVSHSIADDAAHQILTRGALIRMQQVFFQEVLLIEQICPVGLQRAKAVLLQFFEQSTEVYCPALDNLVCAPWIILFALCGHEASSISKIS